MKKANKAQEHFPSNNQYIIESIDSISVEQSEKKRRTHNAVTMAVQFTKSVFALSGKNHPSP